MTYRGHVENGVIQLHGSVILPEGAEVRVELAADKEEFDPNSPPIEDTLLSPLWRTFPRRNGTGFRLT